MDEQPPPRRTSWPWQNVPRPEAKLADHADRDRLYQADPNFGSVVSYPERCLAWGKSSYRGNCDGTLFKELLMRYRPKSVADPMMGSGTTGDVVRGMNRHLGTGIEFFGASFICDPYGRILAEASRNRPEVLVAEVDPRTVETARQHWPFLRDRRIDAYGPIMERSLEKR